MSSRVQRPSGWLHYRSKIKSSVSHSVFGGGDKFPNRVTKSRRVLPMTEAELKKHLDAAEKSPKEIAAAVSGLSEKVLRYKPSTDKWCVLEVLGHLADVEIIYGYRLRQMLADTKPVIAALDQNAWTRNLNYLDCRPSELVAFYGLGRHHNLRLLRGLEPSDLLKSAFHPEMQREITVADLVERMGGHGAAHLQQIEKLKTAASHK